MKRFCAVLAVLSVVTGCASGAPREATSANALLLVGASTVSGDANSAGSSNLGSADDEHIEAAWPLYAPRPEYPEAEKQAGVEANVVVHYQVAENGSVTQARAFGPASFRTAALAALASWRFKPQVHSGAPRRSVRTTEFKFRVRG